MARLKSILCFKDVPLLVGFGTSCEVGGLAGHSRCFCEDSETVACRRSLERHRQDFGRAMIRNENEYKDAVRRLDEQEERLKRGEFDEVQNFSGIGRLLIALRIAKGLTQRELAERPEVSGAQVSCDERNEYHGVTVDRANRILEALDVEVTSAVASPGPSRPAVKKRPSLSQS